MIRRSTFPRLLVVNLACRSLVASYWFAFARYACPGRAVSRGTIPSTPGPSTIAAASTNEFPVLIAKDHDTHKQ